ncbi:unnamed protein product [marine sediment metagenome]|uniref:DUF4349 domain-containing protein n=1 Tax=marine sediment metagenome TaxID=412755 RepID=X0SGT3_9ZZZZ
MRDFTRVLLLSIVLSVATIFGSGCGALASSYRVAADREPTQSLDQNRSDRMLIKRASLHIEVDDVKTVVAMAASIAEEAGGYVENSSSSGNEDASLTMRVPAEELEGVLDRLAALGTETSRYLSTEDVTGEVIDLEATLKNRIALRDRLRTLLERAQNVKDVLLVEEQLTRLQAQIDSMEGRLKSLRGKAKLASLTLYVNRKRILGPLGYLAKGLWWVTTKLFVIR